MDRSYPAIWSASLGAVECELRSVYDKVVMAVLSEAQLLRIVLLRFGKNPEDMRAENRIEIPSAGGPRITLGPCSEAFAIHFDTLMYAKDVDPYFKLYELMEGAGVKSDKFYEEAYEVIGVDHRLTLRIEDVEVTSDDDAREVLMWVGNGALFELDVVPGLGLAMPLLSQQREDSYVHPAELASSRQPRRDYDPQPLFLYWHARSIPETPLVHSFSTTIKSWNTISLPTRAPRLLSHYARS